MDFKGGAVRIPDLAKGQRRLRLRVPNGLSLSRLLQQGTTVSITLGATSEIRTRILRAKVHFLQSVPFALKNIRWLLHNVTLPVAVPTLLDAFHNMLRSEKLLSLASDADNLVVRIFSFSFHRGLPKDESGNGGGFVFDGRSLPNPGREERFKTQSGKDAPVIEYLNQQESVHQFLASVMSLVDASVSNYQQRGFKNLMLSFGCTGGQHRSVYLAEQVAKRLRGRPGIEVVVTHRELERMAAESMQVQKAAR